MRVVRTILGMLLLTLGLPAMLVGGALWGATQHRDPGGGFTAQLQPVTTTGYALLVPDLDGLLRRDVPIVRGATRLRINAGTGGGPAFVGIAPAAEAARYLAGVPYARVEGVNLGTGALPVRTRSVNGYTAPGNLPGRQSFWLRSGVGTVDWSPTELDGGQLSLIVMAPTAAPGLTLHAAAEVRPGWLDPAAWALLAVGTVLIVLGMATLAWPGRRRDIIYVVEPSQVPALAARLGAPILALGPGRPASLAETATSASPPRWPAPAPPPALPMLAWPPLPPDTAAAGSEQPALSSGGPVTPGDSGGAPAGSAPGFPSEIASGREPLLAERSPDDTPGATEPARVVSQRPGPDGTPEEAASAVAASSPTAETATAATVAATGAGAAAGYADQDASRSPSATDAGRPGTEADAGGGEAEVPTARTAPDTGRVELTAVPGAPAARSRRRKTAGGLPVGDAMPVESLVKATRPGRGRTAGRTGLTRPADPVAPADEPTERPG